MLGKPQCLHVPTRVSVHTDILRSARQIDSLRPKDGAQRRGNARETVLLRCCEGGGTAAAPHPGTPTFGSQRSLPRSELLAAPDEFISSNFRSGREGLMLRHALVCASCCRSHSLWRLRERFVSHRPVLIGAPPTPSNRRPTHAPLPDTAPTISGVPRFPLSPESAYAFMPTASDAEGNTLTFSIANMPTWATFDATTGKLSGTPSSANVGAYPDHHFRVGWHGQRLRRPI